MTHYYFAFLFKRTDSEVKLSFRNSIIVQILKLLPITLAVIVYFFQYHSNCFWFIYAREASQPFHRLNYKRI